MLLIRLVLRHWIKHHINFLDLGNAYTTQALNNIKLHRCGIGVEEHYLHASNIFQKLYQR